MTDKELIQMAKQAYTHSYAPYSHYFVGAALLTAEGKIYTGCNIENASYGAANCAERTAIFKAVSEGERNLQKIAVAAKDGSTAYPCGICLQVMSELMPDGEVILEENGKAVSYSVRELLPFAFTL
ncbi:MAG: cytidine deaminase [Lachnospiraceae bacterium]|nr:cytidine deaminase [Lachnospiraceae bacterium]MDE6627591.1 cytidine deaminase [Lachnospiraceae bacterium]